MNVYGEQGYADAADLEDRRRDERARQYVEERYEELYEDMALMAADRETHLSPLDAEYPPDDATVRESRTVATDDTLDPEATMGRFAYDLDHGIAKNDAQTEAWIDSKEPLNQPAEYPPEQCDRCGEPLKHGGHDGHSCT